MESTGEEKMMVNIDTDLLDCSICTSPLCSPLYQCLKGHMVCPSCWSKLLYKCPTCGDPIGSRNIAYESMLDSIHLPCPNANLGCRKSVSYSQMQVHANTCEFSQSLCPIPGCAHKASSGEWREHFRKDHRNPGNDYRYGQFCSIIFYDDELYYTLLGPNKDVFLLVKEPILNVGNALSVYYIDMPDQGQNVFPYELHVGTRDNYTHSSVQLKSEAVSIKEMKRGTVHGSSLLLPLGLESRNMKVNVLINKKIE